MRRAHASCSAWLCPMEVACPASRRGWGFAGSRREGPRRSSRVDCFERFSRSGPNRRVISPTQATHRTASNQSRACPRGLPKFGRKEGGMSLWERSRLPRVCWADRNARESTLYGLTGNRGSCAREIDGVGGSRRGRSDACAECAPPAQAVRRRGFERARPIARAVDSVLPSRASPHAPRHLPRKL